MGFLEGGDELLARSFVFGNEAYEQFRQSGELVVHCCNFVFLGFKHFLLSLSITSFVVLVNLVKLIVFLDGTDLHRILLPEVVDGFSHFAQGQGHYLGGLRYFLFGGFVRAELTVKSELTSLHPHSDFAGTATFSFFQFLVEYVILSVIVAARFWLCVVNSTAFGKWVLRAHAKSDHALLDKSLTGDAGFG